MKKSKPVIPNYTEINEFLDTIPWKGKASNSNFYCMRVKKLKTKIEVFQPPFKRDFYYLGLYFNSGKLHVGFNNSTLKNPEAFLVFHSPGLVYSFTHKNQIEGYIIYFKRECFSFFKPDFDKEFPVFDILHTNLFKFNHATFDTLAPHFEEVFTAYEKSEEKRHLQARIKLLALLYHLQSFAIERKKDIRLADSEQNLLRKYVQLVNNHYIEKRTVQEYARLLSVSSNYLSQAVKSVSDKNALSYISERLLKEAKSFIQYTDCDITEIAYKLNFSDPSNFGRFFKKHTGISPSAYRKQRNQ